VATRATIIVDDVNSDPRYFPPAAFTGADRAFLEEVAGIVGNYIRDGERH
jgi:hypothetical protein